MTHAPKSPRPKPSEAKTPLPERVVTNTSGSSNGARHRSLDASPRAARSELCNVKPWQWSPDRMSELARLVPMWPSELDDVSVAGRQRLVSHLSRALRLERQRGKSGHWAYDLARHAALYRALERERSDLHARVRADRKAASLAQAHTRKGSASTDDPR